MNIQQFLDSVLTPENKEKLNKLSKKSQEQVEQYGKKILTEVDSAGTKIDDWMQSDGKLAIMSFKSKIDEFLNKANNTENDLKKEAQRIFDAIVQNDSQADIEEGIKQATDSIKKANEKLSNLSHKDALESIEGLTDSFMKSAAMFADGQWEKSTATEKDEKKKKEKSGSTHGFTDRDGDGDDIIDDATIINE